MDHRPNAYGFCRRCGSPDPTVGCERAWFGPWQLQRNSTPPFWLRLRPSVGNPGMTNYVIGPTVNPELRLKVSIPTARKKEAS